MNHAPENSSKKKEAADHGSFEVAATGRIQLTPGFAWERGLLHLGIALLLFGGTLFMPPQRGRHGPLLPMPPMQLFLARAFMVVGLGALALRIMVRDELHVDPESGQVQRVRRVGLVRHPIESWEREELAALSVEASRRRFSPGGSGRHGHSGPSGLSGSNASYRPVLITADQQVLPIAGWMGADLLGANTLAEEMSRCLELPLVKGEVYSTYRLQPFEGELTVTMEPAVDYEDYHPAIPWTYWVVGGVVFLIKTVAKAQAGGF